MLFNARHKQKMVFLRNCTNVKDTYAKDIEATFLINENFS